MCHFHHMRRYFSQIRLNKNEKYLLKEIENERNERLQLNRNFRHSETEREREIDARMKTTKELHALVEEWTREQHDQCVSRSQQDKYIQDFGHEFHKVWREIECIYFKINRTKTGMLREIGTPTQVENFDPPVLESGKFTVKLDDTETIIRYKVLVSYETVLSFRFGYQSYEMNIRKWSNKANKLEKSFDHFASLMITTFDQHTTQFGNTDRRGCKTMYHHNTEQDKNMIRYALFDVTRYIGVILSEQQKTALDYAAYFCKRLTFNSYRSYIHSLACLCIEESQLRPVTQFDQVELNITTFLPNLLEQVDFD